MASSWFQTEVEKHPKGCHLVTDEVVSRVPQIKQIKIVQHTSAGLSISENYDPDVRADMATVLDRLVPENNSLYTHTMEGPDDMPAHAKTALVGNQLTIPSILASLIIIYIVTNGRLNLGTWQGIYLCEFRDHPSRRRAIVTVNGQTDK